MAVTPEVNEKRMWNIIMAACFALGGWWLQNQYDTLVEVNRNFIAYQQYVDQHYVKKEFLIQMNNDHDRRFDMIERKLDKLLENKHNHKIGDDTASTTFGGAR